VASHPKPSAKNELGAPLKPSEDVQAKMRPITRAHFADVLQRAIHQTVRKPSPKQK
jgi:hypothetical protein